MIQETVQNILVYVVMMAVLRGLVSKEGFQEIFRFVGGLILILLFASPMVSLFSVGNQWYEKLQDNIFQMDRQQMKQELQMADGSFENILVRECEEEMREQIVKLAEDAGQKAESVEVEIKYKEGMPSVAGVKMVLGDRDEQLAVTGSSDAVETVLPVEEIVIGGTTGEKSRRTDAQTRAVRRKICKKYELSKEVVKVWKIGGKDSVKN